MHDTLFYVIRYWCKRRKHRMTRWPHHSCWIIPSAKRKMCTRAPIPADYVRRLSCKSSNHNRRVELKEFKMATLKKDSSTFAWPLPCGRLSVSGDKNGTMCESWIGVVPSPAILPRPCAFLLRCAISLKCVAQVCRLLPVAVRFALLAINGKTIRSINFRQ